MELHNAIEVDLGTILTVVGSILAPLLTVIGVLWATWKAERKARDDDNNASDIKYESMRDKMQDKVDASAAKALEAISASTTALNSMSAALVQNRDDQTARNQSWETFKQDILRSIQGLK